MNRFNNFLRHHPVSPIMRRMVYSLLLFVLFQVIGCAATTHYGEYGATYYVKTGGNDSLNGLSDATAWATIAKVKSTVKSGDTVYFRSQDTWTSSSDHVLEATAGVTYDGSTYGSGTRATLQATADLVSVAEISKSNVTFRGFNVDGNQKHFYGGLNIGYQASTDISNITIDNCIVHDIGLADDWMYGIYVGTNIGNITLSNVTITNTTVYNTIHEGIAIYPAWATYDNHVDTVLVRNCTVYNTGLSKDGAGVGILVANRSDNVTLEYNNLYNNHRGIWTRISPLREGPNNIISGPVNLVVRYNFIRSNKYFGIDASIERALLVSASIYGNIIYNNGTAGAGTSCYDMSLSGDESSTPNTFKIYNNTFYNTTNDCTARRLVIELARDYGSTSTTVYHLKNNIIYSNNSTPLWDRKGTAIHSNNIIYRSSGASDEHVRSPFAVEYTRNNVQTWEPTAQITAPTFTGGTLPTGFIGIYGTNMVPNADYFSITFGDALNNGSTLGSPYNGCINGAGLATPFTRPQGAAYDIGAYEYVEDVSHPAPSRNP